MALDKQRVPLAALSAFAEAIFPALTSAAALSRKLGREDEAVFYETKGNCSPHVLSQIIIVIEQKLAAPLGANLIQFLHALESRFFSLILCGAATWTWKYPFVLSFVEMSVERRNIVFTGWSTSRFTPLTAVFGALKSVIGGSLFSNLMESGRNPLWAGLGYPNPADRKSVLTPNPTGLKNEDIVETGCIFLLDIQPGRAAQAQILDLMLSKGIKAKIEEGILTLSCAALVIGSGAGGGVSAAVLAQAGYQVLILEKSGFNPSSKLSMVEDDAFSTMYEKGSYMTTSDGGVQLLAGTTVGGGTRVNWGASLRTPDHVLKEWSAAPHSLSDFTSGVYNASMDSVCGRLGVHHDMQLDRSSETFKRGLKEIDLETSVMPSNCQSRTCSSFCCFGCPYAEKQDGIQTYLLDAVQAGAKIITGCHADKLTTTQVEDGQRKKQVTGVDCRVSLGAGESCKMLIKADFVVCAGGSIHSPALLLRSGISCNENVGKNLRIHPCMGVIGAFHDAKGGPASLRMWEGAMMSFYSNDLANWDGPGPNYGPLISTPSFHPGQAASLCPWYSALDYKNLLLLYKDAAAALIYCRDQDTGEVQIDGDGNPVIHYWPSKRDQKNMLKGVVTCLRGLRAAGAYQLVTCDLTRHGNIGGIREPVPFDEKEFENYLHEIEKRGVQKSRVTVFSAHQMGTCRMGASPRTSAVDGNGETWEVKGLFICDASALPTASGVNPMITTLSIAHMNAQKIVDKMINVRRREHLCLG